MNARDVLKTKKPALGMKNCARWAFSVRTNARSGRSRGEKMHAQGVLGANKCTLGACSGREKARSGRGRGNFLGANKCALGAFSKRENARLGRS